MLGYGDAGWLGRHEPQVYKLKTKTDFAERFARPRDLHLFQISINIIIKLTIRLGAYGFYR